MFKSFAVIAGTYLLSVVLVIGTDPLLSKIFPGDFERGHIPSNDALMVSTACFVVVSIFCAWLCARFAPGRAGLHVLWFFLIGELMGIIATIPNWSKGWPHWYWLSWIFSWPVSCWIGLRIEIKNSGRDAAAN